MLTIESISHSFGDRLLFRSVDWQVGAGERCALIGPNGAGKTTLFRILAGEMTPESGAVRLPKGARVGYLPQEGISMQADQIVLDVAVDAIGPIRAVSAELDEVHRRLEVGSGDDPEHDLLVQRAGELQHQLESLGAYGAEAEAARVLDGLGFSQGQMSGPVGELSGGWQMRVALAALVLAKPDLLLLDEPTNHLDIESVRWLEGELMAFPGAVVFVTHDRYLLERLATGVAELQGLTLERYAMTYLRYLEERERRREAYDKTRLERDRRYAELTAWIDRFRYKNTKAKQVQSRIKQRDQIELLQPLGRSAEVAFHFAPPPRSGRIVVETDKLGHCYGDNRVLQGVDFSLDRGDKVGVIGVNGVGKSTFLRLVAGEESPTEGEVRLTSSTLVAHMVQDQERVLDSHRTVLDELAADAEVTDGRNLRSILGAFLFSGDDADKRVKVLSGGEKGRLGLAKILLRKANLLLLDEPTNHLDMASRDVLVEAIRAYGGAILLVSHDRSVLDRVCNKTLYLSEGRAQLYPGTCSELEAHLAGEAEAVTRGGAVTAERKKTPAQAGTSKDPPVEPRRGRKPQGLSGNERRQAQKRIRQLEDRIRRKEGEASELEALLCEPDIYQSPEGATYARQYQDLRDELEMLMLEWEEESEKVD